MSRLSKLYEAMETLRKEGLPVNEDLERKASELEEEIIKKEILPVLSKTIEPVGGGLCARTTFKCSS